MTKNIFPTWQELPSIDLYLDQVLILVNQYSDNQAPLTASMINNYVKHRFIPKPEKKKYTRRQLSQLLIINYLKSVFSIQDIYHLLDDLTKVDDLEKVYSYFVDNINGLEKNKSPEIIFSACQTIKKYQETKALLQKNRNEEINDEN